MLTLLTYQQTYIISKDALGYVANIAIVTIGSDFTETTNRIRNIVTKPEGSLNWSKAHNSKFEVNKWAIMHLSRKSVQDPNNNNERIPIPRPDLVLEGQIIKEVHTYKYLGILIDNWLKWKEQAQQATANTTKWILQFRRLTKPPTSIKPKLLWQLYIAVTLPKITYGLVAWYLPPNKQEGKTKQSGSITILRNLQKIQRMAYGDVNPHNFKPTFSSEQISASLQATSLLPTVLCGVQAMDVEQLNKYILSVLSTDLSAQSYKADSSNPKYSSWTMDSEGYIRIDQRIYVPDSGDLRLRVLCCFHDHPVSGHCKRVTRGRSRRL